MAYRSLKARQRVADKAAALRAVGVPTKEIARRLRLSDGTARAYLKEYDSREGQPASERPALPDPEIGTAPPALSENADALTRARQVAGELAGLAERAKADGNHTAAGRALRDLAGVTNTIKALEKQAAAQGDSVTLTKAELDAARAWVEDALKALAAAPITCASCGRRLRINQASGGTDERGIT